RWLGLGGVPGGAGAVVFYVGGVVAGGGVPGDGDGLAGELERDGAADRVRGPGAGLAGAADLPAIFFRHFDGPSGGIAFDDDYGGCGGIGGDWRQVIAGRCPVADEQDGDRPGAED